jgi:hypothetical protein
MNKPSSLCAAAIVSLGLLGRAGAQGIDVGSPDQPPPAEAETAPPPEASAAPAPEAAPAPPTEAAPAAPPETPPPAPAPAAAAFGEAWHYTISIERAFGIDHLSATDSNYGAEVQTISATNFSLFGVPSTGALSVFSFPRAAFDLFVIPDLSVGLALGVLKGSTTVAESGGFSNTESFTGLTAMPRVGYAWHLAPDVALWPRVGISVVYLKTSVTNTFAPSGDMPAHYVAATVEAPFVFTLVPRVALTVGPTLDITFVGKSAPVIIEAGGQPPYDERITELGVQVGLLINI